MMMGSDLLYQTFLEIFHLILIIILWGGVIISAILQIRKLRKKMVQEFVHGPQD